MAEDRMALLETLRKAMAEGDVDFLREGVRVLAQAIMEAEVTELTGVPHGERDPERRLTSRNGYRERRWDTRVGTIELAIPRVRDGCYFPSLLEPRRRAERALLAVVQEAYVLGVSTRRVDDLVQALGIAGISKSEVSRICAALDAEVEAFRARSLAASATPTCGSTPPTSRSARPAGWCRWRPWSRPAWRRPASGGCWASSSPPATTRAAPGRPSSAGSSSAASTASASSSATTTAGLVKAVREQLLGAAWQRCRVHFTRNAQDLVPRVAGAWSPRPSGSSSSSPTRPRPASSSAGSSTASGRASRPSPSCSTERRARPARPLHVPRAPPPPDPLDQPAGAAQQGDQAPDRGRRHLPQPGLGHPPRRDDPRRAGRRVAGRPALLPARDDGPDRRVPEPEEVSPALLMAS